MSSPAAVSLLEQVKAGKTLYPTRLRHFTDDHLPILTELLQSNWLSSKDDNAKEAMAFVAYRHFADFENLSVATLILAHLYCIGADEEDIVSFIANTDEIDDDVDFLKLLRTAEKQSKN